MRPSRRGKPLAGRGKRLTPPGGTGKGGGGGARGAGGRAGGPRVAGGPLLCSGRGLSRGSRSCHRPTSLPSWMPPAEEGLPMPGSHELAPTEGEIAFPDLDKHRAFVEGFIARLAALQLKERGLGDIED